MRINTHQQKFSFMIKKPNKNKTLNKKISHAEIL